MLFDRHKYHLHHTLNLSNMSNIVHPYCQIILLDQMCQMAHIAVVVILSCAILKTFLICDKLAYIIYNIKQAKISNTIWCMFSGDLCFIVLSNTKYFWKPLPFTLAIRWSNTTPTQEAHLPNCIPEIFYPFMRINITTLILGYKGYSVLTVVQLSMSCVIDI